MGKDRLYSMGVDIWIPKQTLRDCADAKCHEFHQNPQLSMHWRRKRTVRIRVVAPLKGREKLLTTFCNVQIEPQQVPPETVAVEYYILQRTNSNRNKTIFHQFLSEIDYEALLEKYPDAWSTRWNGKSFQERKAICATCTVRVGDFSNCEPRLFGYGTLTPLRNAATELFGSPPATLTTLV